MAEGRAFEKAADLIRLGIGVEDAAKFAGGVFSAAERAELDRAAFQCKIDRAARYEERLDDLIKEQVERGVGTALLWAMERNIPRYAGKAAEGGDIHIHVSDTGFEDIVEEG